MILTLKDTFQNMQKERSQALGALFLGDGGLQWRTSGVV